MKTMSAPRSIYKFCIKLTSDNVPKVIKNHKVRLRENEVIIAYFTDYESASEYCHKLFDLIEATLLEEIGQLENRLVYR